MNDSTPPRRRPCVSSWAVHRALGRSYPTSPGDENRVSVAGDGPGSVELLDVPARLAALGFPAMEICHFHLPSREANYLSELRAALDESGIELHSLLIDDGDITHPEHHARDRDWIAGWIDTAAALGATRARVIAGKQAPGEAARARSRTHFASLAEHAEPLNLHLVTENWFAFLPSPPHVLSLLDDLGGRIGLNLDFGNWGGPTKYEDLAAIASRAEACHAKARFTGPGQIDTDDYSRCLDITAGAGYAGVYTLVDGGPEDVWDGLVVQREALRPYLS